MQAVYRGLPSHSTTSLTVPQETPPLIRPYPARATGAERGLQEPLRVGESDGQHIPQIIALTRPVLDALAQPVHLYMVRSDFPSVRAASGMVCQAPPFAGMVISCRRLAAL